MKREVKILRATTIRKVVFRVSFLNVGVIAKVRKAYSLQKVSVGFIVL